jgi:hypothetical protein
MAAAAPLDEKEIESIYQKAEGLCNLWTSWTRHGKIVVKGGRVARDLHAMTWPDRDELLQMCCDYIGTRPTEFTPADMQQLFQSKNLPVFLCAVRSQPSARAKPVLHGKEMDYLVSLIPYDPADARPIYSILLHQANISVESWLRITPALRDGMLRELAQENLRHLKLAGFKPVRATTKTQRRRFAAAAWKRYN